MGIQMKGGKRIIGVAAMTLATAGCFGAPAHDPPLHRSASISLPNPAEAVFSHCRELVCTQADVPSCDFEQVSRDVAPGALVERIHCRRSEFGTDCEERHAPGGRNDRGS